MKKALILFAHGARDPRWAAPFERLRDLLRAQLPEAAVELAFLELMSPRLPETVARIVEQGCARIDVVPVFFGQGGHVLRDLPPMIEELRSAYPGIAMRVAQAVGESPEVLAAIAGYCIAQSEAQ
jgi:sirohydrochlorin cobaltochelatase